MMNAVIMYRTDDGKSAIDSSDEIYHLCMDGTVYGDLSKLECLIDKLLVADGERE